jgi:SHS2 domain-containing protein
MGYRYLDDIAIADVAFHADGATLEELFAAAADALTGVMIDDLSTLAPEEAISVELTAPEPDLLLFAFLNEIVYLKDARKFLARPRSITIKLGAPCLLKSILAGEKISADKQNLGTDVKAVTMHRFELKETKDGWEAMVVVDV